MRVEQGGKAQIPEKTQFLDHIRYLLEFDLLSPEIHLRTLHRFASPFVLPLFSLSTAFNRPACALCWRLHVELTLDVGMETGWLDIAKRERDALSGEYLNGKCEGLVRDSIRLGLSR